MPRDAAGNYTLPLAPVISGTLITSTWGNTTTEDLAAAMTDSLSRTGNGAMLAALKHTAGLETAPSSTFNDDPLSGLYLGAVGDVRMSIGGTDRMRWLPANEFPQIWDEDESKWVSVGAGAIVWLNQPVMPATALINTGYMTLGNQTTLMPLSPTEGYSIAFADLANDWSDTNFLTLDGNGTPFTQDGSFTYNLDLKGAFAQFSLLNGSWQIVNFGRLSDAYGESLVDYYNMTETDNLLEVKGNENFLINGGADYWQRGVAFTGNVYTADRWKTLADNSVDQSTDVPTPAAPYSLDVYRPDGTTSPFILTSVELSNPAIGSAPFTPATDYTLSFWAKRTEVQPYRVEVAFVDVVSEATNYVAIDDVNTVAATGGVWEKFSLTFNIDAIVPVASNTALQIRIRPVNTVGIEHMFIALAKLEQGSNVTAFTRAGNTLAGELSMCQRYYFNNAAFGGTNRLQAFDNLGSSTSKMGTAQYPAVMRTSPTFAINSYFGFSTAAPTFDSIGPTSARFAGTANAVGESSGIDEYTADAEL